jgi:hypothetical protein
VREIVMLYAVVRLDRLLIGAEGPEQARAVAVVAVLPTRDGAGELGRLMGLRDDDNLSLYFSTPAPYYPGGRRAPL